jgi:tripartite-type tricarboxylate transporter receptor subunit TctC
MRKPSQKISLFISLLTLLFVGLVEAWSYPDKPITLVIPVGAGGSHDLTARALVSVAADYLGQPIIVSLKPGGGGVIGSDFVARSAPDGYTLMMGYPGANSIFPAIEGRSKGPNDLEAICRINYSPTIIVTRTDTPYKTFREMIEWAKANPNKLIYGHTGPWNQADAAWKQIANFTGITGRTVPFDGGGPATVAIIGGHIDVTGSLSAVIVPHITSGKLRGLAVLDSKREETLPNVPTAKEEGYNIVNLMWRGILAPKGTPRPIIEKLADAFKKMTENKSVVTMIKQFGDDIQYLGPDEFTKVWRQEYEAYIELGKIYKKK